MIAEYRIRLPFERPPMSANDQRRSHWSGQRGAKADVQAAVVRAIEADGVPPLDRAAVTLVWFVPDQGVRDTDGMYPMLKAVLDALTPPRAAAPKGSPTVAGTPRKKPLHAKPGAGIIRDDRWQIVPSTTCRIELDPEDPRLELHILALEPLAGWVPPKPRAPKPPEFVIRPRRAGKATEARTVRQLTHADLAPCVQPADGGAAWRARVEAARRRHG
jgi:hypothetical protein